MTAHQHSLTTKSVTERRMQHLCNYLPFHLLGFLLGFNVGSRSVVLRSCLREYLFSEALAGLGLSSAVAVSVCATGEAVLMRDPRPELMGALVRTPGAVLCRTAPSFLRFGSFELPARRGEVEFSRQLAEYCIRHLGPHLGLCHGDETMGSASYMTAGIAVGRERRAIGLPGTHSEEDGARLWACDGETEGLRSQVQHPCRNEEERETRHLQLLISIIQASIMVGQINTPIQPPFLWLCYGHHLCPYYSSKDLQSQSIHNLERCLRALDIQ